MERKEKMDEILRKDGLSLKLLDMLSVNYPDLWLMP